MAAIKKKATAKRKPAAKKRAASRKAAKIEVSDQDVLDYMRLRGQYALMVEEVRERKKVAAAARAGGVKVTGRELQKAADGYRALMDLNKASATQKWFKQNGITVEALEEYLETNILKSKFMDRLEKGASTKLKGSKPVRQALRQLAYRDWLYRAK